MNESKINPFLILYRQWTQAKSRGRIFAAMTGNHWSGDVSTRGWHPNFSIGFKNTTLGPKNCMYEVLDEKNGRNPGTRGFSCHICVTITYPSQEEFISLQRADPYLNQVTPAI